MYLSDPVADGVTTVLIWLVAGLYALWRGVRMRKSPFPSNVPATSRFAVWLISVTKGDEAAALRREALMSTEAIKRSGVYALTAGALMTIGGGMQLVGWILKAIEMGVFKTG